MRLKNNDIYLELSDQPTDANYNYDDALIFLKGKIPACLIKTGAIDSSIYSSNLVSSDDSPDDSESTLAFFNALHIQCGASGLLQ